MTENNKTHDMPILRILQTTADQWSIHHDLRPMLRALDPVGAATQARAAGHAGRHWAAPGRTIQGSHLASHQGHGRYSAKGVSK